MKYARLMRMKHYLKNVLVFLPLIFSKNIFNVELIKKNIVGFVVFSLIASIVYIINDIKDIEKDKKHPVKKNRPLASGEIRKSKAIAFMALLSITIVEILIVNNLLFSYSTIIIIIYLLINILYSLGLKNVPLLDITILSFGFVLRIIYGSLIISVPISNWLFLTILSISFYMSLGKRKNERLKIKSGKTRKVLVYYTDDYLNKSMYMFLTLSIVFYSLWSTFGVNGEALKYSIIFVILIIMKYNMDIETGGFGDPVDVILSDKILIVMTFIYGIYSMISLYAI